jgi:pilus assembly protein CpaB
MSARSLILLLVALLIAGTAAYIARTVLIAQRPAEQPLVAQPAPPPPSNASILAAAADLPAGTLLKPEHLKWQPWPENAITPGYFVEASAKIDDLIGAVVRRGIGAGEPIQGTAIVKPGERGFLAAVLRPGMRAIAIGISDTSGIDGLILPGDRVDLLLTHDLPGQNGEGSDKRRASETVLENIRVLAIGRTLDDLKGEPADGKTATLEVTPKQAEMVAVAVELGRIQLSLRSLATPGKDVPVSAAIEPGTADSGIEPSSAMPAPQALAGGPADDEALVGSQEDGTHEPDMPRRGETYTLDSEVSRLLTLKSSPGVKVQVVQGSKTEQLVFEQ